MENFPLLTIIVFAPLAGMILLLVWKPGNIAASHTTGIAATIISLAASVLVWIRGVPPGFSQIEVVDWIPSLGASYRLGIDGISFPMVLLTTVLFLAALIYSSKIKKRANAFVSLMLLLETACLGVFLSLDLLLFYVFFEVTLVGMYFVIAGWGHENRKKAALTFFIYTLIGSLFLLLALLSIYLHTDPLTFDMTRIINAPPLKGLAATLTFWGLFIAFAIKTPLFPFHTWLPAAHTEAPAAGSTILAGILLKLGTYGFIRFALQMTPNAFREFAPWVIVFAVFSAVYGAFVALAQKDIKRMVAYTSINHMGYLILGVAAAAVLQHEARTHALDGAVLQMVSHGLVTGVLFLLVGTLQDRTETRNMEKLGGFLKATPLLGGFFILAAFASLGLPGLAHFPAEFQIFLGTFKGFPVAVGITLLGLVITAALYLRAIQRVFMGSDINGIIRTGDLSRRELWAVVPLIILIIIIGIFPQSILGLIHATVQNLGI